MRSGLPPLGIDVSMVDVFDVEKLTGSLRPQTKLLWLEVCTNPKLMIADLQSITKAVKAFNKDIIIGVDNTFLSPWIIVRSFCNIVC